MEFFFTYIIKNGRQTVRIGKGHCFSKSEDAVVSYLTKRYGSSGWMTSDYIWHSSEAAALKKERQLLNDYNFRYQSFPLWNNKSGGGGRQIYVKCKSLTASGFPCPNDALAGNYKYCGIHRR